MDTLIDSLTCSLDNTVNVTNGHCNHNGYSNGHTNGYTNGHTTNGHSTFPLGVSGGFMAGKHFLDNPKYLPCCRRKACNNCVLRHLTRRRHSANQTEVLFNCPWCCKNTRVGLISLPNGAQEVNLENDEYAREEYERNLNSINHYLIKKLETGLKNIEDRLQNKDKYLNKRREFIENEIHAQIEALKEHLDVIEEEMRASLAESTENMIGNLDKFEKANQSRLDDMKIAIENLKKNANVNNGSNGDINGSSSSSNKKLLNPKLAQVMQHQSVNSCVENLGELSKINKLIAEIVSELKFEPVVEFPSPTVLIGDLKEVKDANLKEMFKTVKAHSQITRMCSLPGSAQPMPISPRYMCIADPYTLFFTDSQTKQLVQVRLDSGEIVRATNLAGQLKNPDGVCVNPVAGCVYVSDSELKIIFKIDYSFNVLKKFGYRDLKWPRGIFYDYEMTMSPGGGSMSPNRLYVCDPSSHFIAIYNDHEQLRDCLTISLSDEPLPSYAKANEMLDVKGSMNLALTTSSSGQAIIEEELKFCPLNVFVNKTHIYVTDDWTGGNCIRIFDKFSHRLLRNVGDLNAWNPLGLVVDDTGNIFTVARLYYETGSSHLFCFNRDGDLVYKTNLGISNECVTDIVLDNYTSRLANRIICSGDKKIHFFQF